jgi:hypothetical protein
MWLGPWVGAICGLLLVLLWLEPWVGAICGLLLALGLVWNLRSFRSPAAIILPNEEPPGGLDNVQPLIALARAPDRRVQFGSRFGSPPAVSSHSRLVDLPESLIHLIISFLELPQLARIQSTHSRLHTLARVPISRASNRFHLITFYSAIHVYSVPLPLCLSPRLIPSLSIFDTETLCVG